MKCISIRQPWAWLIVSGHKDIENRDWPTHYRGPVVIHASKRVPYEDECADIEKRFGVKLPDDFEVGGIIGTAEIVDCVSAHDSRWFFGAFGFVLNNACPVPFVPMPGKLGLFNVGFELPQNGDKRPAIHVPVVLQPELL